MTGLAGHPCFCSGDIRISDKGAACFTLSEILKAFPAAQEARRLLGDPFLPARNQAALNALLALNRRDQEKILALYARKVAR